MHALPPAFVASAVAWCDTMNVFAAGADRGPVALVRGSSGAVIWTAPGRKNLAVRGLRFSPDGQLLAVRYDGGTFLVLHTTTGRMVSAGAGPVACLAWPAPLPPAVDDDDSIEAALLATLAASDPPAPQPLVHGTPDGKLRLVLLGSALRDIEVGPAAITHIAVAPTRIGVVCGDEFVAFRCRPLSVTVQTIAARTAAGTRAVERVRTALRRYGDEQRAYEANMARFFDGLADPTYLLTYFLASAHASEVEEWMLQQHESGFRRWYKAVVANLDEMRKQVALNVVPGAQKLVHIASSLYASRSLAEGFAVLDAAQRFNLQSQLLNEHVLQLQQSVLALAGVLEFGFGRAIDRVLAITPKDEYPLAAVGAFFEPRPSVDADIEPVAILCDAAWQAALDWLMESVERVQSFAVAGAVAISITDTEATVLSETGLFVSDFASVNEYELPAGPRALCEGVVAVAGNATVNLYRRDQLVKTVPLDIEPAAVALTANAVCAMAKDMRSFAVAELS